MASKVELANHPCLSCLHFPVCEFKFDIQDEKNFEDHIEKHLEENSPLLTICYLTCCKYINANSFIGGNMK